MDYGSASLLLYMQLLKLLLKPHKIILFYSKSLSSGFTGFNKTLLIIVSILIMSSPALKAESLIKCWKNTDGITECGKRIPREYYNQRIRYIDEQGITRKIKERTKTPEEIRSEQELTRLLKLEADQKRKSREYDQVLLKTYLTIDDLLSSLRSKLDIINSRSKILHSSMELKKRQFGNLVRQAANMERSGRQVSPQLAELLDASRKEIRNLQSQISSEKKETEKIKTVFAHDVERFMITKSNRLKHSLSTPSQAKKLHAVKLSCLSEAQCQLLWDRSIQFIREFATRPILYQTNQIVVTDTPEKHQDIAMSLTRLDTRESDSKKDLVFQIRCHPERIGQEFCNSEEISGLLTEFKTIAYKINQ